MNRRSKGFSAERELVRKLWKMGFAAIRGPASGAKVKRSVYPDVVAIKDGKVFVFEVKRRQRIETIYIPKRQIDKLIEFARRAQGEALIAIKIVENSTWKVVPISSLVPVSDQMMKIPRETLIRAEELFNYLRSRLVKPLF